MDDDIRERLIAIALEWERRFGIAPAITSAISELDASRLVGCPASDYCTQMQGRTAVGRGHDFVHAGQKYQVKANRPSGKPGSFVTLVAKAKNYDWDYLIWIRYDENYVLREAWQWKRTAYQEAFANRGRVSPIDMRRGTQLP
jgi:hypothetical protein